MGGSESGKEFGEYDKRLSHTPLKKPTLSGAYGRSGDGCFVISACGKLRCLTFECFLINEADVRGPSRISEAH